MKKLNEVLKELKEIGHYIIDTENKIVITREQLGEMISSDYDEAIECLDNDLFLEAFMVADKPMLTVLQDLQARFDQSERILFHLQYELAPNLQFSYRDVIYRDVASLGNAILEDKAEKAVIMEAMRYKMISFYARYKKLDEARVDIVNRLDFAENYMEKDPEIAYLLVGHLLTDRVYYIYNGRKFKSIITLYSYLSDKKKMMAFSKTMEDDVRFKAWLFYLGFADTYDKWKQRIKEIDYEDFQAVYPDNKEKLKTRD